MNKSERQVAAHYLLLRRDHPASVDLSAEHFTNATVKAAWAKAQQSKGPVDVIDMLGVEMVSMLSDEITFDAEIPHHIDALKSRWSRERLRESLAYCLDRLERFKDQDLDELQGVLLDRVDAAMAGGPRDSESHKTLAMDVARAFVEDLQTEDRAIQTPWEGFNAHVPGILFGKLTIIGGRSSEHKTTLARCIMHYAVEHYGMKGLFWTGEDSKEDIARRNVASEVPMLSVGKFSSGRWDKHVKRPTEDELRRLLTQFDKHRFRDYWKNFLIEDADFGDVDHVCAYIRQQVAKHGIRIFVGDFLQLVEIPDNKSAWIRAMKKFANLAKTLDIIMIWTSQIDKVGTKESEYNNSVPRGIDMLWGSALKQQAYCVLMVGREENRLNVVVDKHKSAKPGTTFQLEIDAPHDRLGNYPETKQC